MIYLNFIKKNWVVLCIVTIVYFAYASAFIKPGNLQNFSLTDDGQVLMQNGSFFKLCINSFDCSKFFDQTLELGTGRYRPVYWVIQDLFYQAFGNNATLHHIFRVYAVGYSEVLLLVILLLSLGISSSIIFLTCLLFFTNYSFSENIIRLGPNEPFQVISLAIFSLVYLNIRSLDKLKLAKYIFLIFLLVLTVLIKETSLAILPTMLLTQLILLKRKAFTPKFLILVLFPVLVLMLIYLFKKFVPSTISNDIPIYTSNYLLNPFAIAGNSLVLMQSLFNSMSPYLKISILLMPFLFIVKEQRIQLLSRKYLYWFFFSIFFVGIMFPWKYLLDRYLLIGIFGLAVVIGIIMNSIFKILTRKLTPLLKRKLFWIIFNLFFLVLLLNLFSRGFAVNLAKTINYSRWYAEFTKFEADQVKVIAKYNSDGVAINGVNNLNDWEFLYEIPIHLRFLYSLNANTSLLTGNEPTHGYLFSRSSFDSYIGLNDPTILHENLVVNNSYHIDQIDPLAFRNKFIMKPVETVLNPPLLKDGYTYYWEIRRITK